MFAYVVAKAGAGGAPQIVAKNPGGAIGDASCAWVVPAEFDGDPVREWERVSEHRFAACLKRIQFRDELVGRESHALSMSWRKSSLACGSPATLKLCDRHHSQRRTAVRSADMGRWKSGTWLPLRPRRAAAPADLNVPGTRGIDSDN
jgi:hypothetical protein